MTFSNQALAHWQERYNLLSERVRVVAPDLRDRSLSADRRQCLTAAFTEAWHSLAEHSRNYPGDSPRSISLR